MKHPPAFDLALFATGDLGPFRRRTLERHVRGCAECDRRVAQYQDLRATTATFDPPSDLNWNALAAEMRANIHLGLEAGACVRSAHVARSWNPRLVLAFASLLLIIGSSFLLRNTSPNPAALHSAAAPVLESTGAGIELRSGSGSMMLLNRPGAVANQTVSAGGEIRARYIDGETGAVTINNVSLE